MLKPLLKIVGSLGIAGAFLWAAFQNVDWTLLRQTLKSASYTWLILSAIVIIFSCLPRAWRWQILLAPISKDITIRATFRAVLVAYAGNTVFPRAGEVARVIALRRTHPVPMSAALGTVVVERVLDMLTFLVLFACVLLIAREQVAAVFPGLEEIGLIGLPALILGVIGLGLLSAYGERCLPIIDRVIRRFSIPIADRIIGLLRTFLQGMAAIHTVEGYAGIALSTLALNASYLLALYLPFFSFDFPTTYNLGLTEALVVMIIATVGVILPTPGGTGTYHFFCTQALHRFYGVPNTEAFAFATAAHAVTTLTFLLFGGPPFLRLLWSQKREKRAT